MKYLLISTVPNVFFLHLNDTPERDRNISEVQTKVFTKDAGVVECQVLYKVPLGDVRCSSMDTEVTLPDASAEAMGHVRSTFDKAGVLWQIATLGKVDQGGGGTVAAYMANRNIVTVDAGVPVLCMHAPLEIVSKLDCYMTMLACKAIYLA